MNPIPPLGLVITNVGLNAFTQAQLGDDVDLTIARVGLTAAPFDVAPTLTALPGEFKRFDTVSGQATGPDTVHMIVRDSTPGTYEVRGFGLFLADGTLFAVYGQPAILVEKSALSTLLLALDLRFPPEQVASISFGDANFLNPPATEDVPGVLEIASLEEVEDGVDDARAVSPKKLKIRLAELVAALTVPIGTVWLFYGDQPPPGWAICDGSQVDRSDGTGMIVTPDLRGRVAVGVSANHALGSAFGFAEVNVNTTEQASGTSLTTSSQTSYAGNGTQQGVKSVELVDPGHSHSVVIDVTQPSLALHYIMKV